MALDVTLVSPYIPPIPRAGGVVGSKAIFVQGEYDFVHTGRFAVIDVAGSARAFSLTPPGGFGAERAAGGASDGSSVWVCLRSGSSGGQPIWLARIFPDGTVDAYPSIFTQNTAWTIKVGSYIWCCSSGTASWRRFDTSTMTWDSTAGSYCNLPAEPVLFGGHVWGWSSSTLYKYDTTTMVATTTTHPGISLLSWGQVAIAEGYAWWPLNSLGRLLRLSASGAVDVIDTPVAWGPSLCVDSQGYLRSTSVNGNTIVGWHPSTERWWSEPTGIYGFNCTRMYAIGDKTISGVG